MVKFNQVMEEEKAKQLNPVVLAFVGDAVHSLYIREKLVFGPEYKTGTLQKLASAGVSAKGQAAHLAFVESMFTETERDIFLRGRNAKKPAKSKSATVAEYNLSTGFEAVIGYLYLIGDYDRLNALLSEEEHEI